MILAFFVHGRPKLGSLASGISAVGPTIPSFALIGLLVVPLGFGVLPSVVVVTFYATLPIRRPCYVRSPASVLLRELRVIVVLRIATLGLVVAGCATGAVRIHADELTKNGRLVSGTELRQLFTQATVEGTDSNGVEYSLRTGEDGSYKGVTTRGDPFVGTWSIDDHGDVCFDTVEATIRLPCTAQYVLDGRYYGLTRSGTVLERTVRRTSPVRR